MAFAVQRIVASHKLSSGLCDHLLGSVTLDGMKARTDNPFRMITQIQLSTTETIESNANSTAAIVHREKER